MSDHPKMEHGEALRVANLLIEKLKPFCERIEIAGSLRRKKPLVSDIELVLLPKLVPHYDLLGQREHDDNLLLEQLWDLLTDGVIEKRLGKDNKAAFGERYQRVLFQGVPCDLFSVLKPAQWGVIFLIRTGSAAYSHNFVSTLPYGFKIAEGALWKIGRIIETPEERDVNEAIGKPYVEPEDRT